jgi:hypothetical protein
MKKGLYLTGFDGRQLSNGEKLQPSVSGVGEHTTVQGTTVVRSPSQNNTPIYQGYTNQRTYLGAVACLNLIANRAIPSFPTTDRSAPSTFVVVYPSAKGSVGNTMPQFPLTFHYKEWKIIVLVAKDYKDSAFISSLLSRKQYLSAIEHLEAELKERYLSASLIPPT